MMDTAELPLVRAAMVCERVLTERDGVLSAVRILDRLIAPAPPEGAGGPLVRAPLTLLLMLVGAGVAPGPHRLLLHTQLPGGERVGAREMTIAIPESPELGCNIVLDLRFEASIEGLYWFWVAFDAEDRILAGIPLHVERAGGRAVERGDGR